MKKCHECGTEMPDDSMVCPKCGAPQAKVESSFSPNYVKVTPSPSNVWDSQIFAILPFIAAILFTLGALIFLITSFIEWEFIFAGLILFVAAIANLVSALPKFLKQFTNK